MYDTLYIAYIDNNNEYASYAAWVSNRCGHVIDLTLCKLCIHVFKIQD